MEKLNPLDYLRPTWAVPLLIASVIALLTANEVSYQRSIRATESMERIIETRLAVQKLKVLAIDAETGQRGYLLTGKDAYLVPYTEATANMDGTLDFLRNRLADNPPQLAQFAIISRMLARKLGEMDISIRLRQSGQDIAWRSVVETDQGKQYMDAMRDATNDLMELISKGVSTEQKKIREALLLSRFAIGVGAILGVVFFLLYLRQTRRLVAIELNAKDALRRERDSLEDEVSERTARLSELANHLETTREDERAHLARELHDELGALLTAAKLDVARLQSRLSPIAPEVGERIDHLIQTLNAGIALKRRIIEGLRPSSLSNLGLLPALEILARESADRSGVNIETHLDEVSLDSAVELTAYRFVQEALTNVMKYSAAKNVFITLENLDHHIALSVKDDGIGFDLKKIKPQSYGLTGMRQRVEAAGGRMQIKSAQGSGTLLTISLPTQSLQQIQDTRTQQDRPLIA
jgi:signal transduction histidine kinase